MDLTTGLDCVKACIFELKKRFLVSMIDFTVYLINKNGIQNISDEFNTVVIKK
jgi:hypothetical protein